MLPEILSQKVDSSLLNRVTRTAVLEYYATMTQCPTALGLYLCVKYNDDIAAASHDVDPHQYIDAKSFRSAYVSSKLLSKLDSGDKAMATDRKNRAIEKFWSCEEHLRKCAPRLKRVLFSDIPDSELNQAEKHARTILYGAREKIAQILGSAPSWEDVSKYSDFGPGSSTSVPRRKAHPSQKYVAKDVSASCLGLTAIYRREIIEGLWYGEESSIPDLIDLQITNSSRVVVVPKNFKIDRVIAFEPDWNIFFQKGLGALIRRRLKRFGIDLDRGGALHEELARLASIDGVLATLDLSSASDLVSTLLVRFLLPEDWFIWLNTTRTSSIESETGDVTHLTKFSSMGNGFTFELESLIYFALAKAAQEDHTARVSVFGDDIICPVETAERLIQVFEVCGFRVNSDKSYWTGMFRESCGAHFFNGLDVKPIYLKGNLTNDFSKFKFANSIRRLAGRWYGIDLRRTPFRRAYNCVKRSISRVFYIPEGYGDGGLVEKFDKALPATRRSKSRSKPPIRRARHGIEGFRVRCLLAKGAERETDGIGLELWQLRRMADKTPSPYHANAPRWVTPRDDVSLIQKYPKLYEVPEQARITPDWDDKKARNQPSFKQRQNLISVKPAVIRYRVGTILVPRWLDPIS